jgi:metallo-beta-lactamase family protein
MVKIKFLGACGTVTGSKYLLSVYDKNYLIDCGLFQGDKETKQKNWNVFPFDLNKINGIILTHSHIDHSGFLPRLCKMGYKGPVFTTSSTKALLYILLPDTAELQEEEARYAEKEGYTIFKPPLPLFTIDDAKNALKLLVSRDFYQWYELADGISFKFNYAGHILGASFLEFKIKIKGKKYLKVVFSGDLGRKRHPIIKGPDFFEKADYLILESTYGDRLHPEEDIPEKIAKIVNETFERKGILLIPAFAVDRTQEILVFLSKLIKDKKIDENITVYIDSPMALEALNLYKQFHSEYNEEFIKIKSDYNPFGLPNFKAVKSIEESKNLNHLDKSSIIISASGMCNGGRIEHHLKFKLPDERNTILFVGFQAEGTKGRKILDGKEKTIKIHSDDVPIRARVEKINALSSHADYDEILWWLENSNLNIKKIFITHGEDKARENLKVRLKEKYKVETEKPNEEDEFEIL